MLTKVNLKNAGVDVLRKILFHPSLVSAAAGGESWLRSLQLSGEQIVNITPAYVVCSVVTTAQNLEQTNKMGCDDDAFGMGLRSKDLIVTH